MAKAKEKNNNSTKSFVMLIVTGVVLVSVTLCWFVMSSRNEIKEITDIPVANESSSFANIYYGADENGKIAIRPNDITQYKLIETKEIVLENMFPGAEYTFMAKFPATVAGQKITLNLDGIRNDVGTLLSSVKLNRRVSLMDGEIESTKDTSRYVASEISLSAENDNPFEYTINEAGEYRVFYSFKIDELTTSEKENMSIMIENVDAVLSSSGTSDENNENS